MSNRTRWNPSAKHPVAPKRNPNTQTGPSVKPVPANNIVNRKGIVIGSR